jgi:hypothetical protein
LPPEPLTDPQQFRRTLREMDPACADTADSLWAFAQQDMVPVFRDDDEELRLACLLRTDEVEQAVAHDSFDFDMDGGTPGIVGRGGAEMTYEYEPVGHAGPVPLLHYRSVPERFGGTVIELAEDFRLFWNLYEDREQQRFLTTDEVGDVVTVAEWVEGTLLIKKSYLRRYQAARQLHLSLQIVLTQRRTGTVDKTLLQLGAARVRLSYATGNYDIGPEGHFARLIGKRIIDPPPIERSGVWPYQRKPEYEEFVIGLDEDGEEVLHTSDPGRLANYFGANPGAPHYLTPVLFDRSVLDRYYGNPERYEVEDGLIRSADAWTLYVDNALDDHVSVFLGDLGRDLPTREQRHWKAHNVTAQNDRLSETAYRRSFLAQFHESDRIEHRLAAAYQRLNQAWDNRFGWSLYKEPHEDDSHVLNVHVPTNESLAQFEIQIVPLAKLVVDFLNEEAITHASVAPRKRDKGIAKLELLLGEQGLPSEPLCAVLRRVQGARSRAAAHRKGEDFSRDQLLAGARDPQALFVQLLDALVDAMNALTVEVETARR